MSSLVFPDGQWHHNTAIYILFRVQGLMMAAEEHRMTASSMIPLAYWSCNLFRKWVINLWLDPKRHRWEAILVSVKGAHACRAFLTEEVWLGAVLLWREIITMVWGQCDATGEFGWGVAPQYTVRTAVNHLELNTVHPTLKFFFCQLSEITTLLW